MAESVTLRNGSGVEVGTVLNPLVVSATLSTAGLATDTNQTSGAQKTQIVDGSGNVIAATSNALDINIKSGNPTTITATQATGTNLHTVIDSGTITAVTSITNAVTVNSHAVTNAGTFAVQAAITAASGSFSSGALASGSVASGAVASGAIASGALASGSIAAGAIAAGATSIADNEDVASAGGDRLVKVAQIRLDTPVSGANVDSSGDYTQIIADSFGKTWTAGTYPEDLAHVAGEPIAGNGSRRIDTLATSAGTSGDWATVNQTAEGSAWTTLAGTATANGLLVGNFTSGDTYTALTSTAQVIKASAGNMYGYYFYNPNSSATYILIYNIAAASVTVGTSTASLVFSIPATSGANLMFPVPIPFSNAGWSIAAATTGGGNTAPATALEAMVFYL